MLKFIRSNLIIGGVLFLASCASSMTPMQVSNTLPSLTQSEFISQSKVEEALKTKRCKYLVKGRSYVAPIGTTVKNDLKNGAKGIDEWVQLDGGNSYVLTNYQWITVDHYGSTQLEVEFNTMICE